ncbi:MAG: acetyl-CoA carboxylase biotin carboxyl carrier protein [Sphaerochaeta sp.]|jgi:acetyl-CoA carboxylase biotin carboxyl carrier protein|nr:acetyl-CoA carboxylase biotin carboxyl carrier protein [Sphaerochaeta sp.]PKL29417.1 MAG: acetyl-CoA carboxylase biotin carboxyl carrier protein [Spirochaetae bacterium HGW-Spirochaetae-2]
MEQKELQQFITIFENSSLSEIEITCEQYSLHMKKPQAHTVVPEGYQPISHHAGPQHIHAQPAVKVDSGTKTITSPIVGTFYRTPSPDSPPYVEVGDTVHKGDVVCTLEAMKLMNQLEAEYDCEIVAVLADQGALVEFGQPLFEVKPL